MFALLPSINSIRWIACHLSQPIIDVKIAKVAFPLSSWMTYWLLEEHIPNSPILRYCPVRADLSPPPKRIRDSDLVTDLEISSDDGYEPYVHREFDLGVDFKDNYEPYTEPDIDSDINECITYVAAIRAGGMDDRDVVETVA
ncbi:hypothetical protein Tco_1353281 [Tanacetum coccineum]